MSGFASKNTYSFTAPSTTSKPFGFSTSQTTPFQTKSSGNLFQSSSTTAFQPSTSGNMFRPQQSTNSWAPSTTTTTTNLFQTQPHAQQPPTACAMSGFQMPSTTTNLFQTASTQPPAQQPAPQSGFQVPSTTTTNLFQPQPMPSSQPSAPPTASTFTQQDLENHLATCSVAATTPDATEVAQREKEVPMWTPNVHRDIYNILLNPYLLNIKYKGDQDAGAVLVAKQMTSFAFVDKVNLKGVTLPAEWTILSDELLLNAIDHIGEVTAMALAVLKAFEKYLETKVKKWTGVDVANLSIEFLFCFGHELTPKFDLNHRLRTRQCTLSEQQILQSAPYTQFVSSVIVKRYQKWDVIG
jgi:hypothetical protein